VSFEVDHEFCRALLTKQTSLLDYGCGSGQFLQLVGDKIGEGVGIDLDARLVEKAASDNRFPNVRYLRADASANLPFENGRFDVIVTFGVLEHVGPERPYIQEFHRLLRPGGSLVIAVPSMGPFRMFDIGNIKYNFPYLHRWFYYHVARQPEYYERTFGADAPMFGQFSRSATRHNHYGANDLVSLTAPYFRMDRYRHYGLFFELIQFAEVVVCKPFGLSRVKLFAYLIEQDCKLLSPLGRANIVAVFRREACSPAGS
jgi:SAM-dependent methyltransferase